jgi:hypothetical protein
MKNLNESRKRDEDIGQDYREDEMKGGAGTARDVVQFQHRSGTQSESGPLLPLLPQRQVEELRARWTTIQASFVDEPRKSVQDADELVGSAIKQLEEVFFSQRAGLEKQWSRGDEVSTENLRVAFQHYRDFFDRLLSMK